MTRSPARLRGPTAIRCLHLIPLGSLAEVADQISGELGDVVAQAGRPHEFAKALLGCVPAAVPAVVVLEGLHLADDASLDVLRVLVRLIRQWTLVGVS